MRKLVFRSTSKTLSEKGLWNVITTLEDYPQWCKFCTKMMPTKLKVGAVYHDITTIMWFPFKIKHVVTRMDPHKEFHTDIILPRGGKMQHKFIISQEGDVGVLIFEVVFDLGSKFRNATVGYILEKRWMQLARHGFPGMDEVKRVQ